MADPGEGEVVAEQISQILDPLLAPAVPEKVAIPPWFGQDTPARLGRNLPLIMVFVYCLMKISFLLCPPAMESRMMKRMINKLFRPRTRLWSQKYDNGEKQEEYQYYFDPKNNKRLKNGWYKSYFEDGRYKEVGRYKKDVKDGEWSLYEYSLDVKKTTITYNEGTKWSGEYVEYWDDGKIKREENYKLGKKDGRWARYGEDGNIISELEYKEDGRWGGNFVEYFPDGKIKREEYFRHGKKDGKFFEYYESSELKVEGNYTEGELNGMYVWYYESKMIRLKGNYKGGENDGGWIWYDNNGNITSEKVYEEGRCVEGDC